ncbi:MAG: membrane integrity-associated transporter subunit PqiC [Deltaproteobacteria bacterium]|nr:membrane integrity-associated transporter subunit PqiC [Deltaproteobacteria bacterium]
MMRSCGSTRNATRRRATRGAVLAVGMALVAGCTLLSPRHDPSRFYTLSARLPAALAPAGRAAPLSVTVGPVTLPAYLDRNEVAVRVSPSELRYALAERWAEPLVQNVTRVLVEDLGNALASDRVASVTTAPTVTPDFFVEVVIVRFEADVAGGATLTARWAVRDTGRKILRIRQSQHARRATAATTEGGVDAMSAALGDLAEEIAAVLTELAAERR